MQMILLIASAGVGLVLYFRVIRPILRALEII